ncbi:hypothetical protein AVEN_6970-1 [Araneus ventricosus]|uniref:Uncharacterized protein n=1 Tax=Araneus ventricosus TaxID=182803 RepID=A0A4Y2R3E1_ARAVE|nr:hypothetical protein AVEN_6970-1 [Araneus ventricosus]
MICHLQMTRNAAISKSPWEWEVRQINQDHKKVDINVVLTLKKWGGRADNAPLGRVWNTNRNTNESQGRTYCQKQKWLLYGWDINMKGARSIKPILGK